jgi:uncharacterized protein YndB with AHSA1/START domain
MTKSNDIVFEKLIHAPADLIYRAFTSATAVREWLCHISTSNPEEGGWFNFAWNNGYYASGHFINLVPNGAVSMAWIGKNEPNWTVVEVTINPTDNKDNNLVRMFHKGFGEGEVWDTARQRMVSGWELGLNNLKSTLEDGIDLRIANRPVIGIYPEDVANLNESTQTSLNIPINYGVLVTEPLPDYGAEKAGIQKNDVIYDIDGKKVENIRSLTILVNTYKPGDQLNVAVYRDQESIVFSVETMAQGLQDVPSSPEELAKALEAKNFTALEALESALSDISETEASFSPGPEEWSAKEVLVHLIHDEREIHRWMNDLVSDQERFYVTWPGDRLFRIRATLTSYPNIDSLIAELRRSLKETIASVAFLDQSFTRRKASYRRLAIELLGATKHIYEHIEQIKNNIMTARSQLNQ